MAAFPPFAHTFKGKFPGAAPHGVTVTSNETFASKSTRITLAKHIQFCSHEFRPAYFSTGYTRSQLVQTYTHFWPFLRLIFIGFIALAAFFLILEFLQLCLYTRPRFYRTRPASQSGCSSFAITQPRDLAVVQFLVIFPFLFSLSSLSIIGRRPISD